MQDLRPRKWQNRLCDAVLNQKQSHKTDRRASKQRAPCPVHPGDKYRFMPQPLSWLHLRHRLTHLLRRICWCRL
jgi:hypothetical protein